MGQSQVGVSLYDFKLFTKGDGYASIAIFVMDPQNNHYDRQIDLISHMGVEALLSPQTDASFSLLIPATPLSVRCSRRVN